MDIVTYNNLITENAELKRELTKAKKSLRDEVAMAALTGLLSKGLSTKQIAELKKLNNGDAIAHIVSSICLNYADAFMIERDKR